MATNKFMLKILLCLSVRPIFILLKKIKFYQFNEVRPDHHHTRLKCICACLKMTYDHSGRISDSGHAPDSRGKWADDSSGDRQKIIN